MCTATDVDRELASNMLRTAPPQVCTATDVDRELASNMLRTAPPQVCTATDVDRELASNTLNYKRKHECRERQAYVTITCSPFYIKMGDKRNG